MKKSFVALAMVALMANGAEAGTRAASGAQAGPTIVQLYDSAAGIRLGAAAADTVGGQRVAMGSPAADSGGVDDILREVRLWGDGLFGAFMIVLLLFVVSPAVILSLLFHFIWKVRKQKMHLAEVALEKGVPLPDGLVGERLEQVEVVWRKGIRNVSVGLGLVCIFAFVGWGWSIGVALFVTIYGVGQMVIARTSAANGRKACGGGRNGETERG